MIEAQQWIDGANNPQWGQNQSQICWVTEERAVYLGYIQFQCVGGLEHALKTNAFWFEPKNTSKRITNPTRHFIGEVEQLRWHIKWL